MGSCGRWWACHIRPVQTEYSTPQNAGPSTRLASPHCPVKNTSSVSNNVLHHKLDYRKPKRNQTGISKSALVAQINTYRHPCLEEGCYIDGAHLSGLLQTIQASHTGTGGAVVALPRWHTRLVTLTGQAVVVVYLDIAKSRGRGRLENPKTQGLYKKLASKTQRF